MHPPQPLGDQAILIGCTDEREAVRLVAAVRRLAPAWLIDVVQSYAIVAVFFDPDRTTSAATAAALADLGREAEHGGEAGPGRLHHVSCCYDLGPDLERVAKHTGLSVEEVIRRHAETEYTVYAIGFCPGFPYLGYLPAPLAGVPRLPAPRLRVEPGSVGLTGRQTGIYTEARPGGWNLIGRTPLVLVDVEAGYFPLRTGDRVRFVPIDRAAFEALRGRRL